MGNRALMGNGWGGTKSLGHQGHSQVAQSMAILLFKPLLFCTFLLTVMCDQCVGALAHCMQDMRQEEQAP